MKPREKSSASSWVAALYIAGWWLFLTIIESLENLGYSIETPSGTDNTPFWLKICDTVVWLPTRLIFGLIKWFIMGIPVTGISVTGTWELVCFVSLFIANSLAWGFGLVFLYHGVMRIFGKTMVCSASCDGQFAIRYPDGSVVCENDKVITRSQKSAVVMSVLKPGTELARNYYTERNGGLLLRFENGKLQVVKGITHQIKFASRGGLQ